MQRYTCFLLDARGAIRGAEPIGAADDAEAWEAARRLLAERPNFSAVEVWERQRRIDPAPGAEPPALRLRRLPTRG
jgi:hypothetical protein